MNLPPKRFQDPNDPIYDSIRFLPWFHNLVRRREKLPILKGCYNAWTCCDPNTTQEQVAEGWGIDSRELRDYADFIQGESKLAKMHPKDRDVYQTVIDLAYSLWVNEKAAKSFSSYIEQMAEYFKLNPRAVREVWEVDPCYYPTQYKKGKNG